MLWRERRIDNYMKGSLSDRCKTVVGLLGAVGFVAYCWR